MFADLGEADFTLGVQHEQTEEGYHGRNMPAPKLSPKRSTTSVPDS